MAAAEAVNPFLALLRRARRGEAEALGALLELHRAYLRVLAQRALDARLRARLDASDLVQQTCLSAYRNFVDFQGEDEAGFVVWLRRILERNLHDALRQHVRARKRAVGKEQAFTGNAAEQEVGLREETPSQRAMAGERAVLLAHALEQLPPEQREAVRLRHLEGHPLAQIAHRLGRSEDAVAGLLKRGMRALRKHLGPKCEPGP